MSFLGFCGGEKFKDHFKDGTYCCAKCGNALFKSDHKFQHGSPWPAFSSAAGASNVKRVYQDGHNAYKVACGACGYKLGHEFLGDGPKGGSRF